MIIAYVVSINFGFGGVKYFQKKENAEKFAKENNETVETTALDAKEYFATAFSDPYGDSYFSERVRVPISLI